ncbi:MAG: hypothetical protein LBQ31_05595 [Bacteroidales bacterium]|jgi:hypothetical protein|nr:hypothetical protein [Bacteroidales bacterium]
MEILKKSGTKYYALAALLAIVYFVIIAVNTFNVPENDDFGMLKFINDWINASSFSERFDILFVGKGIGYHTLLPMKIILLISYYVFGVINLSFLIFISNLFLIGIVLMLIVFAVRSITVVPSTTPIISLLVTALILNGQNFETSVWAMVGLCNVGTLLWILLAIFFTLRKNLSLFYIGILFSIITVFSNGNGLFILPILVIALLFQKRKRDTLIFAILVGLAVVSYILLNNGTFYSNFQTVDASSYLERFSIQSIIAFFTFIGCSAYISASTSYIAIAIGIVIVATYLYLLFTGKFKNNLFLFSFFSFMILTAMGVAINRDSQGMADARFRIYGSMFLAIEAVYIIENIKRSKTFDIALVCMAVLFNISSTLLCYQRVDKLSENKKASTYLLKRTNKGAVANLGGEDAKIEMLKIAMFNNASKSGFFKMPEIPIPVSAPVSCGSGCADVTSATNDDVVNNTIECGIDTVLDDKDNVAIRGWAYSKTMSMPFTDIYLQLYNDSSCYEFPTMYQIRPDIIPDRDKKQCGFFVLISKSDIPADSYFVGIKIRKRFLIPIKSSTQTVRTQIICPISH